MCNGRINEICVHTSAFIIHFSFLYSAEAVFSTLHNDSNSNYNSCYKNTSSDYVFFTADVRQAFQSCVYSTFCFTGPTKVNIHDSLLDSKECREKVGSEGLHEAHRRERGSRVGEKVKETDVENHLGMDECGW